MCKSTDLGRDGGDLNTAQNRPALAQQPDVYLEPKWLRYLEKLQMLDKKLRRHQHKDTRA